MTCKIDAALRGLIVAVVLAIPTAASALPFGPFPIEYPSAIVGTTTFVEPTGSISIDISSLPVTSPVLFSLTDVSVLAGSLSFVLDPTLASPALGILRPDGSFLIPTLFLRGTDPSGSFDLAVPNVTGLVALSDDTAIGIVSVFAVESGLGEVLSVGIYAGVPEPGTALLVSLGCAALALRGRKEIAR